MSAERFTLDSNILIYSADDRAGQRTQIAREVIERARHVDCHLTLQAVSEFFSAATRKGYVPLAQAAGQATNWLTLFGTIPASSSAVRVALVNARGRRSYWDALLIATAAEGGCRAILTEDLQDGAMIGGVRVVNPFGPDGVTPKAMSILRPIP